MANEEHLTRLKKGMLTLARADLRGADLTIAVFRSAYGNLGDTNVLPGFAWPSPRPLPEGEGE
jgi:hypothetical protein